MHRVFWFNFDGYLIQKMDILHGMEMRMVWKCEKWSLAYKTSSFVITFSLREMHEISTWKAWKIITFSLKGYTKSNFLRVFNKEQPARNKY